MFSVFLKVYFGLRNKAKNDFEQKIFCAKGDKDFHLLFVLRVSKKWKAFAFVEK